MTQPAIPSSAIRSSLAAIVAAAALALAGCGHSDKASDAASADNVEMPAEEAMSGADATATPTADASATASDGDAASASITALPTNAATESAPAASATPPVKPAH